jgi:hypothetical protein
MPLGSVWVLNVEYVHWSLIPATIRTLCTPEAHMLRVVFFFDQLQGFWLEVIRSFVDVH